LYFSFSQYGPGNLQALLAVLISPLECLGEVQCHAISYTRLLLLSGGLLERVRPASLFFTPCQLTNSKNIVQDGEVAAAITV
jgi:hypothetical protein